MFNDIITAVTLSQKEGEDKKKLLSFVASFLLKAFQVTTISTLGVVTFLFLLGFTNIFGPTFFFTKYIFLSLCLPEL